MASPSQPPDIPPPDDAPDDAQEDETADLPLTMSASVVLDHLPRDAHAALETAGEVLDRGGAVVGKVKVRLSPLPNTAPIRPPVFNCGTAQRFEFVVRFLRRRLGLKDHEGVFCYVNSVFAPGLDEGVGNLWRCFKVGDELVVSYSVTQAFG